MKVTRIGEKESYNITSVWIRDFASTITKESNYLDRVKERKDLRVEEKFANIEDKMHDIKNRIGFLTGANNAINKSASDCDCGSCEACSMKEKCTCGSCESCNSTKILEFIVYVLNYMKSALSENPSMVYEKLLSKCRNEIPQFYSFEGNMCPDKLKKHVGDMRKPSEFRQVEFIPSEGIYDFEEDDNDKG